MPVDLGRPIAPIEEVDGGAVTVQQKAGKEAQPCAPARCWAYCFLNRKEGARQGLCGSCVQPSVKAALAIPAQAPIR